MVLSAKEENSLDKKAKALYNQMKFEFVHIC